MKLTIEQYLKSLQGYADKIEKHPRAVGVHATADILKITISPANLQSWLEGVIWNVTSTCKRCNDNGCPVCDTGGIGGANKQYNPEAY